MLIQLEKPVQTQTVRQATFNLLRALGITTIFGNPGSTEETFLEDFPRDFKYILALQEASVVAMADGYSQITGQPALVNIHTGAGLGNAMASIMSAYQNKTPLIITAGQQTREMLLLEPWLTNVDAEMVPRPWVKWSYQPVRAQDVPAAFMRAYAAALQPPAGPVFLSLPMDDWEKPSEGTPVIRTVSSRVGPDPVRLAQFAERLSDARSPLLVFGASVDRSNAWAAAVALAEKTNAPVYCAPACERTPFPENHPLYQGALPFAIGPLCEKLRGHDVVLVVGAPVFRYYPYIAGEFLPQGTELLHITEDPAESARAPVGDSLVADSALALVALVALVPQSRRSPPNPRPHRSTVLPPVDGVLKPEEVFAILEKLRPDDSVIVDESPSNIRAMHQACPITQPASFFSISSGALGWSMPASVGIALADRAANRQRPIIMIVGDGAFQYSIQSLYTAAQHKLPIVFLVLRNNEYAILKSFAKLQHSTGIPGLDLPGIHIVSLAQGYGCPGQTITTRSELSTALTNALRANHPTVLDIVITAAVPNLV